MTNRTKANAPSKNGKPTKFKHSGTTSAYFGAAKDVNKARGVRKRDATLAALPQDDTIKPVEEADEKRLALKSLKDGAHGISKAIEGEAKSTKANLNPFQNITQSPIKYETLDLDIVAPPKNKTLIKPAAAKNETVVLELPPALTAAAAADKSSYQYSHDFHDIDKRDEDDDVCVTEYVADMYEYFSEEEHRSRADPDYMIVQTEISPKMRAILIDWLALVCTKSKLCPDVLYLTVNVLDRFLDKTTENVTKKNLQLVGTACVFISSKYEDIYHIPVDDLVYLCDRAYTAEQIYEMEHKILKTLNYQISLPTTYKFLLRFLNAGSCGKQMIYMSTYILELSMLSIKFIDYLPSELAAAAVMIARRSADRNLWSPTLLHYSGYTEEEILPVAREMIKATTKYPDLTSAKRKYSSERKLNIAYILPKSL